LHFFARPPVTFLFNFCSSTILHFFARPPRAFFV
jgi:hypothetical protein